MTQIKTRLQKAHTIENAKKSLPNSIKLIAVFAVGLIIDPHTGTIDPSVLIETWREYQLEISGFVSFIIAQDFYRKRG